MYDKDSIHSLSHSFMLIQGKDDYAGQMSGDRMCLKFSDICLMGEEQHQKNPHSGNLSRTIDPGQLRERHIRYSLSHNGGQIL